MKHAKTKLYHRIEIAGDFDTYAIEQYDNGSFITVSEKGYDNSDAGGHRSLVSAIQHVYAMIKTEYVDRCLEEPK